MHRIRPFATAALLAPLFCTQFAGAQPALRMPAEGWRLNTFDRKARGDEVAVFQAPDGSTALRAKFLVGEKMNLSLPFDTLETQRTDWPETFTGLKGFFWNDGDMNVVTLGFRTGAGDETPAGKWSAHITLDHKGWKAVRIPSVLNFQSRFAPLAPREVTSVIVSSPTTDDAEVGIGTLYWEQPGSLLPKIDVGNAGTMTRTPTPPQLDGTLDEAAWAAAETLPLAFHAHSRPGTPEADNRVRVLYDDEHLYLGATLPFPAGTQLKTTLTPDDLDVELWKEEFVEFFVHAGTDPRLFRQLSVSPHGARTDLETVFDQVEDRIVRRFKESLLDWRAATRVLEDAWIAEIAIPWSTLEAEGPSESVQFQAMRGDFTVTPAVFPVWSPVMRQATQGFGILTPATPGQPAPAIRELIVKRLEDDRMNVSGLLEATQPLGTVRLEAIFSAPDAPPVRFACEETFAGQAGFFDFSFDAGSPISGFHQAVVRVQPAGADRAAAATVYAFQQVLPSRFAFDDLVLNPEPKELQRGEGAFTLAPDAAIRLEADATPRTARTAAYLAERLHGLYGIRPAVGAAAGGAISLAIRPDAVREATRSPSPDAYLLDVTPEGIAVTGAAESGLYYGVVTLLQAASAAKQPGQPVPALSIRDFPSFPRRIMATTVQFHSKKDIGDGSGGYRIDLMKRWIERQVAGGKYNVLVLCWANQVNYPSIPEVHHPANFTPEEVSDLFAFAREHFLETMPGTVFGAHATSFTQHFPELIEERWGKKQMDVTLPGVYSLMERLFNDLLDMAGPETRYFDTKNDEWWHGGKTAADVVYKGKTRQEIFRSFLMAQYELLKRRGVRMAMFSDMLVPEHNGRPPFNLAEVAETLPRDIVMLTWSGSSTANERFQALGYEEVWGVYNGFTADPGRYWRGDTGFGRISYPEHEDLFNQTAQERTLHYCFHSGFQAANYAWNRDTKGMLPMAEWTLQYLPSLMGVYSLDPNPAAGTGLTPLRIADGQSAVAGRPLPGASVIGGIPMETGAVTVRPGTLWTLDFAPETRLSSLYLLHNVAAPDRKAVTELHGLYRKVKSSRPYGLIVGTYRLRYADGTSAELPLRLGRNIALVEHTPAQSRYVQDCRAVLPLADDQSAALNQLEWVNPHPEKTVLHLDVECLHEPAPLLLAGVTTRSVRDQ